jgi:hypothetical protein
VLDPMQSMKSCQNLCTEVPEEVYDLVLTSLTDIPGENEGGRERDDRAIAIAPAMARDGWRFCPCYAARRTLQHYRIFDLVHTNMANRLAHRILLTGVEDRPGPNAWERLCPSAS